MTMIMVAASKWMQQAMYMQPVFSGAMLMLIPEPLHKCYHQQVALISTW